MRASTRLVCRLATGLLVVQGTCLIGDGAAHAQGGSFGGGGFHGGSIGNAGSVGDRPYNPGGYSSWGYAVGPTTFEGEAEPVGSGSAGVTVYRGSATEPPAELQGGTGVYVARGSGDADGPSWDADWWNQDPRAAGKSGAGVASDLGLGTAVESLPIGHDILYGADRPYYFHGGIYYQAAESGYQVVAPPIGIEVKRLPSTAELVEVDRRQYLVCRGVYYQALFGGSGIVYRVVNDPNP